MPAVGDPHNNRLTIDAHAVIQNKGKRDLFGQLQRHHRAQAKALFGKIAHHSAVGRWKLDVDETHRALARASSAFGLNGHSRCG